PTNTLSLHDALPICREKYGPLSCPALRLRNRPRDLRTKTCDLRRMLLLAFANAPPAFQPFDFPATIPCQLCSNVIGKVSREMLRSEEHTSELQSHLK